LRRWNLVWIPGLRQEAHPGMTTEIVASSLPDQPERTFHHLHAAPADMR
jgi:hypothetical protein